ncbi:MAG: rod shape-determining protein RodA [Ruminococcaceae bacterium]|nr:rod shape-determining protein RodA [Oscillospiraceae bacterium]
MKDLRDYFKQLDYVLIALSAALALLGILMITSATHSNEGSRQILVQSLAVGIGVVCMLFVAAIDYGVYEDIEKYLYIASIGILIFVLLFGQGKDETGANSWIRVGGIGIQPSELVKLSFAITFSLQLSKFRENINAPRTVLKLLLHFAVLAGLVILQNDTGTALVFCFMFLCMLFAAGLSFKYIAGCMGVFLVFAPFAWFVLMRPYQKERILVFLNPERDASGSGYQVLQSKIAIGSGEFLGRGYMQGPQNQLGMLPEKETDFIFGVIGEEFGFIGCILVLLLLLLLIIRCIYIGLRSKNDVGCFMCIGIASMFIFHTFENILMCIGLMPVTGIPLPFLSYGGSSALTNFIAIGLVLSVWSRRRTLRF